METVLKHSFEAMHAVMDHHMTSLNQPKTLAIDTKQMLFENKRAFENFRNALSSLPSVVKKKYREEIETVLEKNRKLTDLIGKKREAILAQRFQNAKGKRILRGYQGGNHKTYRFMNMTG